MEIIDRIREWREERKEAKEEKQEILDEIRFDAEAIKDLEPEVLTEDFIKEAIKANGECLYYLDKKYSKNVDMVILAARTKPEFMKMIPAEELFKGKRWLDIIVNMRLEALRILKSAKMENPDITYAELKEMVGTYLKGAREIYREKRKEYKKAKKASAVKKASAKKQARIEADRKKLKDLGEESRTLEGELEDIAISVETEERKFGKKRAAIEKANSDSEELGI